MRFSQILGIKYHKIHIKMELVDLIDLHFTGAAHHFWRFHQASNNLRYEIFHHTVFTAHLLQLMKLIYENGNFSGAIDPTGLDLHLQESWNPKRINSGRLPDPDMFNSLLPDHKYCLFENHPNDRFLPSFQSLRALESTSPTRNSLRAH